MLHLLYLTLGLAYALFAVFYFLALVQSWVILITKAIVYQTTKQKIACNQKIIMLFFCVSLALSVIFFFIDFYYIK
jgi:hypothetical protein